MNFKDRIMSKQIVSKNTSDSNSLVTVSSLVYNEDCMIGLKRFSDNYFDLAICDIPYGIDVGNMAYLKETKTTVKQKNGTRLNGNKQKSHIPKRNGIKKHRLKNTLMNCEE